MMCVQQRQIHRGRKQISCRQEWGEQGEETINEYWVSFGSWLDNGRGCTAL